jgi:ABC-type nitrate/sulfonate/bicarbonate transport system permease component
MSAGASRVRVLLLRLALLAGALLGWEAMARSGLLFEDVVPSLAAIAAALATTLGSVEFYSHLVTTLAEIAAALLLGGSAGLIAGLVIGATPLFRRAFEPLLYYLGSTPKLIFFPVMIMLFGVGVSSKIALGAISCFFPVALSVAAGMREINPVLVLVGRSFRAQPWDMARKIYLPAMRQPVVTGFRLGLGIALIATLLGETKLSNRGVGHLIIQAFTTFDMPRMYALLLTTFAIAIAANALMSRLARTR